MYDGFKPNSARMSPENTHKLIGIYIMEATIHPMGPLITSHVRYTSNFQDKKMYTVQTATFLVGGYVIRPFNDKDLQYNVTATCGR